MKSRLPHNSCVTYPRLFPQRRFAHTASDASCVQLLRKAVLAAAIDEGGPAVYISTAPHIRAARQGEGRPLKHGLYMPSDRSGTRGTTSRPLSPHLQVYKP